MPDRQLSKMLFCVALLIVASARAAVFVDLSESTEGRFEPLKAEWTRETCTAMAAGLAPCLAADTPVSELTTAEEATCCETLAAFEQAGCFW